ncbi:MAG TPA: ribosome maturation factor RimP [Propionibacterium sp.]|nr:ribosome maturation factor RimP [Propionibacterium sp.]
MKQQAVEAVVGPVVEQCGLEVDRIEIASAGKRSVLRIYLDGDGPEGRGPSLDEIAEATRALSVALDESDATGNAPYTLEVSSRGVSRPLTEPKHYRRNIGRLVALTLADGRVTGRITGADADGIDLDVDGAPRRIDLTDITKAVVQAELRKDVPGDESADEPDDEE